jgi:hypothetical protein
MNLQNLSSRSIYCQCDYGHGCEQRQTEEYLWLWKYQQRRIKEQRKDKVGDTSQQLNYSRLSIYAVSSC